jgi:hypothetical protein
MLEVFNNYQAERAFSLAHLRQKFEISKEIVKHYPDGVNIPVSQDHPNDRMFLDSRLTFALYLCMKSVYQDLANEGLEMLAIDILGGVDEKRERTVK